MIHELAKLRVESGVYKDVKRSRTEKTDIGTSDVGLQRTSYPSLQNQLLTQRSIWPRVGERVESPGREQRQGLCK